MWVVTHFLSPLIVVSWWSCWLGVVVLITSPLQQYKELWNIYKKSSPPAKYDITVLVNTVNVVIFAGGKFHQDVRYILKVGVHFMIPKQFS